MKKKQTSSTRKKKYSAPALEKGLDVLELLSTETDGLTISEITQRLNKSVGELFRMLVVLEERGYITCLAGTDSYSLTLKMFELSHRFPPTKRLIAISSPILQKLSNSVKQSCHVVVHYDGSGRVVVQQDPPSVRVLSVRLGANVPLIDTCSGHILLAFSDKADRKNMISSSSINNKKNIDKQLQKHLEKVKIDGFESIKSAQIQGVLDIGAPIFDHSGCIVAALVIPFLAYLDDSHPVNAYDARKKLLQAALEISKGLGYVAET